VLELPIIRTRDATKEGEALIIVAVGSLMESLNSEIDDNAGGVFVDSGVGCLIGKGDGVRFIESRDEVFEDAIHEVIPITGLTADGGNENIEHRRVSG
jgi:hypothetical protein